MGSLRVRPSSPCVRERLHDDPSSSLLCDDLEDLEPLLLLELLDLELLDFELLPCTSIHEPSEGGDALQPHEGVGILDVGFLDEDGLMVGLGVGLGVVGLVGVGGGVVGAGASRQVASEAGVS